jgi:hypothetical protein
MAAHESSAKHSRRSVDALQIDTYCTERGIASVIRGSTGETTKGAYQWEFRVKKAVKNG